MKTPAKVRGFTLIELLTVIAIIGVLATILVPVVGEARNSAKRAKCLSNVRLIGLSLIVTAHQNKDLAFPANSGLWAWDVAHSTVKELVRQSGREVLYCPSSSMTTEYGVDRLFFYPNGSPDSKSAVTSYVLLISRTPQIRNGWTATNPVPDYLNERIQSTYNTENYVVPASRRPLVVDAIISNGNDFRNISGALTNNVSSHMAGNLPAGGHAAFVDGHVKWRSFQRGTASQVTNLNYFTPKTYASPSFWF